MTVTRRSRTDRAVGTLVAVAAAVFVWALLDAFRLLPREAAASEDAAMVGGPTRANGGATDDDAAALRAVPTDTGAFADVAIARNAFSSARRPPTVPYRLVRADAGAPRDAATDIDAGQPALVPPPEVLGTAATADGRGFAMCAWGGAPAVVVRAGDPLGPYTVVRIERGRVVFRDADGRRLAIDAPDRSAGDPP